MSTGLALKVLILYKPRVMLFSKVENKRFYIILGIQAIILFLLLYVIGRVSLIERNTEFSFLNREGSIYRVVNSTKVGCLVDEQPYGQGINQGFLTYSFGKCFNLENK